MTRSNGNGEALDVQGLFSNKEGLKELVELVIQEILEAEINQHVGAERHERSVDRRGYRNGSKPRTLATRVGKLELQVPQARECEEGPYEPSFWTKWQRSEQALISTCAEMYFQGVSTRKVSKVLQQMGGFDLSAAQVSRMAARMDEQLSTFRSRSLSWEEMPFIMLDARYEKIRENGQIVSKALLTVIGINTQGRREVLDWRVRDSESEQSWSEVLQDLKDRGLHGVRIVISDAHRGIRKAIARHLQGAAWQRCRVHLKRNLLNRVGWKLKKELSASLKTVFVPQDREECLRRADDMAMHWQKRYPWISGLLSREELEPCLTVNVLPNGHRYRLKSTNMLERVMQELKRRSKPVRIFPNAASCERLLGMLLLELHEKWQVEERPYLNMGYLANPDYPNLKPLSGRPA